MEVITKMSKYYGVQGIYALVNVNKPNSYCSFGTPYVGQGSAKCTSRKFTMGVAQRIVDHRSVLRKGKHHNPKLQRAWNKYGEESFVYLLLERVSEKTMLTKREQFWMDSWQSLDKGYNCQTAEDPLSFRKRSLLTYDIIKDWVNKYHNDNGRYPSAASGSIKYAPNNEPTTWQGLCVCLMGGWRGLPGGITLADFLDSELGVVTRKTAKNINDIDVIGWIEDFYKSHGYYPTKRTKEMVCCSVQYGKLNWCCLDALLRKGQRGLAGGSSLTRFIRVHGTQPIKSKHWHRKEKYER